METCTEDTDELMEAVGGEDRENVPCRTEAPDMRAP